VGRKRIRPKIENKEIDLIKCPQCNSIDITLTLEPNSANTNARAEVT